MLDVLNNQNGYIFKYFRSIDFHISNAMDRYVEVNSVSDSVIMQEILFVHYPQTSSSKD